MQLIYSIKLQTLILILICLQIAQAQKRHNVLFVDSKDKSEEFFESQYDNKYVSIGEKIIQSNKDIYFVIEDHILEHKKQDFHDTLELDSIKRKDLSIFQTLIDSVQSENPLYPYKVFPELYILEQIDKHRVVCYRVKWKYMIK